LGSFFLSFRLCPPGNLSKIAHTPTFPRTPQFFLGGDANFRFAPAAEAKTETHQKMMEEMARAWSEVAEEAETKIAPQRWGAKDCGEYRQAAGAGAGPSFLWRLSYRP
jgi:hypothetical protein